MLADLAYGARLEALGTHVEAIAEDLGARRTHPATAPARSYLRVARSGKLARHTIGLQLGRARYDLGAGRSRTLEVRLAEASKRLAGRNGRLTVIAVAITVRAGKIARSSQRLTLVLPTATRTNKTPRLSERPRR
jgi:hypothetical protein